MGYRSEIYIRVDVKHKNDLIIKLKESDLLDSIDSIDIDSSYVSVYFSGLKWYDGYSDVDNINKYIKSLPESEGTLLRTGEEAGDIEEIGSSPWDLDLGYYTDVIVEGFDTSAGVFELTKFKYNHPELFV